MMLARRDFLSVIGGGLAAPALSRAAWSQAAESSSAPAAVATNEPNPDFTYAPGLTTWPVANGRLRK